MKVNCIKLLIDGTLASGGDDKIIFIWNLTTLDYIVKINPAHSDHVLSFEQTPKGYLISGSEKADGDIKVWNATNGSLLFTLTNPYSGVGVNCLKMINGTHLASGLQKGTLTYGYIIIWDVENRTQVGLIAEHTNHVNVFELLANGFLASGSNDRTIKIWNMTNNTKVQDFSAFANNVFCLKQIRDGSLAIGGADTSLYFWNVTKEAFSASSISTVASFIAAQPCQNMLYYNNQVLATATNNEDTVLMNVTSATATTNTLPSLTHIKKGIQWLEQISMKINSIN